MTTPIAVPIVRPALGEAEAQAAARIVRSGWLMMGPEVAAFEAEFARAVNAAHAIAVANGTLALELALRGLGIGRGDEVITVSHSFIATANAVLAVGARPVLVDVEPDTFSMAPDAVKRALSPRTKAILCAHQVGFPADLRALAALAEASNTALIEDAACALGSRALRDGHWETIGKPHGRVACFSFHPRKVITTGEGGMLTTGDAVLAQRIRLLRQHGLATPAAGIRAENDPDGYLHPGHNARLTDLAAAIGRPQLARLTDIVRERRALADEYLALLGDHPVLAPPRERPDAQSNWQSFPVYLRESTAFTAPAVLRFLAARGISGRAGLTNAHEEPAYTRARGDWQAGPLPVSESLRRNVIFLPLFHGMTAAETQAVKDAITALAAASPG